MPGTPINLGACGCCTDPCEGWYCCIYTGEVAYAVDCEDLEALGACEESSDSGGTDWDGPYPTEQEALDVCGSSSDSDSSTDGMPCSECFGPGTPHPTDATPATLTATYVDQGLSDDFVWDGNWDFQCGDSSLEGILNASAHLCAFVCEPERLCTGLILNTGGIGDNESVELTILSCDPFIAEGTSINFGYIIVSE